MRTPDRPGFIAANDSAPAPFESTTPSSLWFEFAAPLRAFLARRVPAGVDPDDVLQEVFLRMVRHLPTLRDAGRTEAWLYQIARNSLIDATRAWRRREALTEPIDIEAILDDTTPADVRSAEAELARCLTPFIGRLKAPYRAAIELTTVEGLSQIEAASRAGISVSGMKSRVQRARGQLKAMLLECCHVDLDARGAPVDCAVRASSESGKTPICPLPTDRCGKADA